MKKYESLKLENQLCFPLYVCSKEIIKKYKPFLDEIDLTYTQYITMMVLWSCDEINIKNLGEKVFLDSGTLTPVIKKLEEKGYLERKRNKNDRRNLIVSLTENGKDLSKKAKDIPLKIGKCLNLNSEEAKQLYELLYKVIFSID